MIVKYFGHNCYLLSNGVCAILIDPWLDRNGAFFGSWFQWPINHHLLPQLLDDLKGLETVYLYISHEHQDHFDIDTIKALINTIDVIIIPKYHDEYLERQLSIFDKPLEVLNDRHKFYFNDTDYLELMIIDTGVNHDSLAIINIAGEVFVNQNDCKIYDRLNYLNNLDVTYYAVQFSGANWHPVCYDYTEEKKIEISQKKVKSKLIAIKNAIKLLNPDYYLPSAGPAVFPFLDENLSLGDENIFIHQNNLDRMLPNLTNSTFVYLRPGEIFDKSKLTQPINPPTKQHLLKMRNALNCEFDLLNLKLQISDLKWQVQKRLDKIRGIKIEKCPTIIFNCGEECLIIDLNDLTVMVHNTSEVNYPNEYIEISGSEKYFALMSDDRFRWQDIYLSLRAEVKREPDIFNTFVNIFIYSDVTNIRQSFLTTLSIDAERMIVINPLNGCNYEVQRYCPHNGADLIDAKIDEAGNLVCPRHNWLFNLENGGKCANASATICAVELDRSITLCETIHTNLPIHKSV